MSAIEVRALSKRYGRRLVLDGVTFSAGAGEVWALLGPNGAGKTTTLRIILGLARPSGGSVTVRGRVAGALDDAGAHPDRTARDHLRVLCAFAGLPRRRADAALAEVGLAAEGGRTAGELSLGMRRRLALAGVVLVDPAVLVLDEPANALDPEGVRWLRDLLRARARAGATVLLSTHLLGEAELIADHAVVFSAGRTVAGGALAALDERVVRLRAPAPAPLLAALEAGGARVCAGADGAFVVRGASPERVGELAAEHGVVLHELGARRSLEELYLRALREAR